MTYEPGADFDELYEGRLTQEQLNAQELIFGKFLLEGGSGSGDRGHSGRPGERGGSGKGESKENESPKFKNQAQALKEVQSAIKEVGSFRGVCRGKMDVFPRSYSGKESTWKPEESQRQALFQKMGVTEKEYERYHQRLADWISGQAFKKALAELGAASQEILRGNIRTAMGKCLAIDNALCRIRFGGRQRSLYRGLSPASAKQLLQIKDSGVAKATLKTADLSSYTRSKRIAMNFARGLEGFGFRGGGRKGAMLRQKIDADNIMFSFKTAEDVFKNSGFESYLRQKECVVATPKNRMTVEMKKVRFLNADDD